MGLPQPNPDLPHLADVVPSVLSAMGAHGFDGPIPLPDGINGACVLLVDGLGAELLDTYADDLGRIERTSDLALARFAELDQA